MKDQESNPEVVTFGCRLNTVESEIIKNHAINAGLNNATIFNTCGVTEAAEKQAIKEIKKIKKEN
ncbi:MAG: tRNA (N(6)-L-threonylcarbamoyladenosine(37)-C(2))-methylthiotransferase MtaB, partial [Rhodospirillaceae bacterium]|nr:tRNA (N(6)-L-threonylcarbamoyladenosine(37)-C(2))-methylthiotransferase MtaB [Rhodospirillaceae bacterium]